MPLETEISKLSENIAALNASLERQQGVASNDKSSVDEDASEATKPVTRKKKKATRRTSRAKDFMSVGELNDIVKPLAQELGTQAFHISDLMAEAGWKKLSDVPEEDRADLAKDVQKLHEDLMAEAGSEDELGFVD